MNLSAYGARNVQKVAAGTGETLPGPAARWIGCGRRLASYNRWSAGKWAACREGVGGGRSTAFSRRDNRTRGEGRAAASSMRHAQGRIGECQMARTTKQLKVRELQRTLYRAAKADPARRFHALYDKVSRRDVSERAWELVRANKGAAGIDEQTIADIEQYGVSRLLDELATDLRDGSYRALPARRVFIPKPSREGAQRPLSIPAVRDRVVQAAMKIVIEPIFEADFLPCSFGFRPKRSQHDALQVLIDESRRGRRWVLESDIANCFEAIPHSGLMSAIEERVSDRNLLKLLRATLRAGVMADGAVHREVTGTPQGGVVSPVLATSICIGSTGSGQSAGQGCWCASRMTWWCAATANGRPRRHFLRFGRSWPSWA